MRFLPIHLWISVMFWPLLFAMRKLIDKINIKANSPIYPYYSQIGLKLRGTLLVGQKSVIFGYWLLILNGSSSNYRLWYRQEKSKTRGLGIPKCRNISSCMDNLIGVFPKWNRTFGEFREFRESDKSLKHELGSI